MPDPPWDTIVLGAGAAGLLAAERSALRGRRTLLLEKNRKAGVKILMSGGTRCNLTQSCDRREIAEAFGAGKRFLYPALGRLGPDELVAMFEGEGLATKVEATGKVFPVSDRALDVQRTLLAMLARSGAELALDEPALEVDRRDDGFVVRTARRELRTHKLIICVGGQSYPGCGTVGDGYAWARHFGHTIVQPRPSLVPLTSAEPWLAELKGVTLDDVRVSVVCDDQKKPLAERRGGLLFTHFGLSGPAVMDVSRAVTERPQAGGWRLRCDFLPASSEEDLTNQIADNAAAEGRRGVLGLVSEWLPKRLAEALLDHARTPRDRNLAELAKGERSRLIEAIKRTPVALSGSLGFKKAEVTAGGVTLAEVNPKTLESRLAPGLHFAGEVLDLDGPIGGYNFTAAFATGALAGESV
ncbi:N-methyltryptophan oxidase [Pseudobythopirellula maris]|uniref:N-methyltryptophan oxidase n=1 Tax=Pseudobythopirellula maris TaxID=2527991 RepID=A0A5C5ZP08_9BACT|nr:NAD(P)/FAD-dependent oxidoreductase [Pseudobythopirellula maris]TWT88930.1 N-methyltryptophan oxidase [Pseudobythopirellula maris]